MEHIQEYLMKISARALRLPGLGSDAQKSAGSLEFLGTVHCSPLHV